jgi:hypothetical protein
MGLASSRQHAPRMRPSKIMQGLPTFSGGFSRSRGTVVDTQKIKRDFVGTTRSD